MIQEFILYLKASGRTVIERHPRHSRLVIGWTACVPGKWTFALKDTTE